MEGFFKDGQMINGKAHIFYKNGNPCYIGELCNEKYNGRGTLFHKNGALMYQGYFENGNETGKEVVIYDDNGSQASEKIKRLIRHYKDLHKSLILDIIILYFNKIYDKTFELFKKIDFG